MGKGAPYGRVFERVFWLTVTTAAALAFMTSTAGAAPEAEPSSPEILACHNADTPTQVGSWPATPTKDRAAQSHRGTAGDPATTPTARSSSGGMGTARRARSRLRSASAAEPSHN